MATYKINEAITAVGASDFRLELFENLYPVPEGVSYNSYLISDEKTAVLDGVDASVADEFFGNIECALDGRNLDYIVVNHLEPDHSAALGGLISRYPSAQIVGNAKTKAMAAFYLGQAAADKMQVVTDGQTLSLGKTELKFVMTPMVHWPESMMCYESNYGILFSQDAFGSFGAVGGGVFDTDAAFNEHYIDEMRRYYANIVGKYGVQVAAVLGKAAALDIKMICPLHGLVIKNHIAKVVELYKKWSAYIPEKKGVFIACASMHGNTKRVAFELAERLAARGVTDVAIEDLSKRDVSYSVAKSFEYSNIVVASPTYNGQLFPKTEYYLSDLKLLNLSGRAYSVIENGSWAATAGKLTIDRAEGMKNSRIVGKTLNVRGGSYDREELDALSDEIAADLNR